jgi:hypothetical protein
VEDNIDRIIRSFKDDEESIAVPSTIGDIRTSERVISTARALTPEEENREFINFVGYAISDYIRAIKDSKVHSSDYKTKMVAILTSLKGSREQLGGKHHSLLFAVSFINHHTNIFLNIVQT